MAILSVCLCRSDLQALTPRTASARSRCYGNPYHRRQHFRDDRLYPAADPVGGFLLFHPNRLEQIIDVGWSDFRDHQLPDRR